MERIPSNRIRDRRYNLLKSCVLGFAVLASTLVASPSAEAALPTCGSLGNFFDGFYHDNVNNAQRFEGASAYIVVRNASLCGTDNRESNFTTAWSMIEGAQTNSPCEWAQSGFERNAADGVNLSYFAQITRDCFRMQTLYSLPLPTSVAGTRHIFRSTVQPDSSYIASVVDSTTYLISDFNVFATWSYPYEPQFLGEASYVENDIPGNRNNPTQFTGLGAQNFSDDRLVPMPCTMLSLNENPSRWFQTPLSCDAFNVGSYF